MINVMAMVIKMALIAAINYVCYRELTQQVLQGYSEKAKDSLRHDEIHSKHLANEEEFSAPHWTVLHHFCLLPHANLGKFNAQLIFICNTFCSHQPRESQLRVLRRSS
jgi:hypothetical protein